MIDLGYGAVAVGERDLAQGVRGVREHARAGLPLLCANLYENGARVLPAVLVREVEGTRVGVLALLGEEPREPKGFEIRDPAAEGRAALAELRGKADVVILLAHMERERLAALLPALPGVDLVVRGHTDAAENASADCADTTGGVLEGGSVPVLFAGDRARAIGSATIVPRAGGGVDVVDRRLVRLDASVPDDTATARRVARFFEEESARRRELDLSRSLSRDPRTGAIVERYLGMDVCARCHADIVPRFLLSRHFRAIETIRARGEAANPECLSCHATGYGRPTGYDPVAETEGAPYLLGVQCEACHGPGTLHARDGSGAARARASCRQCHTSKWSPDFEFETYWARAAHCGSRADSLRRVAP